MFYTIISLKVNVASRMESTGEPRRVQITASSADLLEGNRNYILMVRGNVAVKVGATSM